VIQKARLQGVSTRSVNDLVRAIGMDGISKSPVSRLRAEIGVRV
jgi:putative transposase